MASPDIEMQKNPIPHDYDVGDDSNSSVSDLPPQTLSMHLRIHAAEYHYLLEICGGLQYDWADSKFICLYKWLLYGLMAYSASDVIFIGKGQSIFLILFIFLLWIQTIFSSIPVIVHSSQRLRRNVTSNELIAIPGVIARCQRFCWISWALMVLSAVLVTITLRSDVSGFKFFVSVLFFTLNIGLPLIGFSVWGLFFILVDVEQFRLSLSTVASMENSRSLSMAEYKCTCDKQSVFANGTLLLNLVAGVAYLSVIGFIIVAVTVKGSAGHVISELLSTFFFCAREFMILQYVLPSLAEANGIFDSVCMSLAGSEEWLNNQGETCSKLWILLTQQPLVMKVFGVRLTLTDIWAQVGSFVAILMLGIMRRVIIETVDYY